MALELLVVLVRAKQASLYQECDPSTWQSNIFIKTARETWSAYPAYPAWRGQHPAAGQWPNEPVQLLVVLIPGYIARVEIGGMTTRQFRSYRPACATLNA